VDTLRKDDLAIYLRCYQETKNDSMQVVVRRQIYQNDPTQSMQLYEIGKLYMRLKDYNAAAAAFKEHYQKDPDFINSYLNYASCQLFQKNYEEARVALRAAVERKPEHIRAHFMLGNALTLLDSTREARKEYETVLRLGEADEEANRNELAEAHANLGVQYLIDKQYEKAYEHLKIAVKLNDQIARYHLWLAQTCQNLNRRDEAVREYRATLKLDATNKEAKKGLEILEK
jgi:tetratricopeptide (TPR) repeat protein